MSGALRPYQLDALDRASQASATSRGILLVLPTGTGKTRLAVEACRRHVAKGGTVLFVVPRRELVTQAKAAGVPGEVRTIQELTRSEALVPEASLVVLDEARHYVADEWGKLRAALPDATFLGLDATPERGDGRGLGGLFDVLIEAISVKDAVAQGYLVPCEVVRPERPLGTGELAQDPVDATLERRRGSTVLFAPTVELAQEYAGRLREANVTAKAVWGAMPARERDYALELYARGVVEVLCNVNLLTEGWDAPRTETVVLARGFGTAGGYLQAVGRALRPWEGKTSALLVDLRGCSHVHGDPDEPRTWHLSGKAARRAAEGEDVRFCPVCGSPTATTECETCGYAGDLRKRKPRVLGLPMDRFARFRAQDDEQAAKTLGRWLGVAASKGYRPGWAFAKFQAVYGRAPTPELKRRARSA